MPLDLKCSQCSLNSFLLVLENSSIPEESLLKEKCNIAVRKIEKKIGAISQPGNCLNEQRRLENKYVGPQCGGEGCLRP